MSAPRTQFLIGLVVAAFVALGVGWVVGADAIGDSREKAERRIEVYSTFLRSVRAAREGRPALDLELQDSVDRTLGSDLESADSVLRAEIASIAMANGLDPIVQITGTTVRESPAKREFKRTAAQRAFRDEPDFVEVRASVVSVGELGSIVSFLHALDAAPWLKRIESIRLDPERRKNHLRLSVRLMTIFMPGRIPSETELDPVARRPRSRYAVVVEGNPFGLLTVPVAVIPAAVEPEPAEVPEGKPGARWRLTGLVDGPDGVEAWLLNVDAQEAVEVRPGEAFDAFVFDEAKGDIATFTTEGETFRVLIGSTLNQRLR